MPDLFLCYLRTTFPQYVEGVRDGGYCFTYEIKDAKLLTPEEKTRFET